MCITFFRSIYTIYVTISMHTFISQWIYITCNILKGRYHTILKLDISSLFSNMIRNLGNLNLAAPSDRNIAAAWPRRIKMLLQMLGGKHNLATHRNVPKNRRRSLPIKGQLKPRPCFQTSIGIAIGIQRGEHLLPKGLDGAVGLFPGTVESKDLGRLVELDAGPSPVMLLVVIGSAGSVLINLNVEPSAILWTTISMLLMVRLCL